MNEKLKPRFDLIDFKVVWINVNDTLPEYGEEVLGLVLGDTLQSIPPLNITITYRVFTDLNGEHWAEDLRIIAWATLPKIPEDLRKVFYKNRL